jgi:MoxR-like ATPase
VDGPRVQELAGRILGNVERVMVGKRAAVEAILVAMFGGGHVLVEDVPGVGKTTLVRAIAVSVGCEFRRIQFTPDLLPSDVIGISLFHQPSGEFRFQPGPIMSQIVLADEINRTSPKTQSSLLEAMEERQVTVDGRSYPLPQPFLLLATQNPVEYEGTFPLPEAQLDRFSSRIRLGYPDPAEEREILSRLEQEHPLHALKAVADPAEVLSAQTEVKKVFFHPDLRAYLVRIVERTRNHPDVFLGASPRGSIALFRSARALAAIRGRPFVLPDDVKAMAVPVLSHRMLLRAEAELRGVKEDSVIEGLLREIPVPPGGGYAPH